MDKTVEYLVAELKNLSKPVTDEELKDVATVSAGGNEKVPIPTWQHECMPAYGLRRFTPCTLDQQVSCAPAYACSPSLPACLPACLPADRPADQRRHDACGPRRRGDHGGEQDC
jgi:hypothetical protein